MAHEEKSSSFAFRTVSKPQVGDYSEVDGVKIEEKNVNLKIAEMINAKLDSQKIQSFQTRYSDREVSEEERARLAVDKKADIVVSLHTGHWNASLPVPTGIEPTLVLLVVDNSGSMRRYPGKQKIDNRGDYAKKFLKEIFSSPEEEGLNSKLRNDDLYFGVAKFSSTSQTMSGLEATSPGNVVNMGKGNVKVETFYADEKINDFLKFDGITTLLYKSIEELLFAPVGIVKHFLKKAREEAEALERRTVNRVSVFFISDGVSDTTSSYKVLGETDSKLLEMPDNIKMLYRDVVGEYPESIKGLIKENKDNAETEGEIVNFNMVMIDSSENNDLEIIREIDKDFFASVVYTGSLDNQETLNNTMVSSIVKKVYSRDIPYGVGAFYSREDTNKNLSAHIVSNMVSYLYPDYTDPNSVFREVDDSGNALKVADESKTGVDIEETFNDIMSGWRKNYKNRGVTNVEPFYSVELIKDKEEIEAYLIKNFGFPEIPENDLFKKQQYEQKKLGEKTFAGGLRNTLSIQTEEQRKINEKAIDDSLARSKEIQTKIDEIDKKYAAFDGGVEAADEKFKTEFENYEKNVTGKRYRTNTSISLLNLIDTINAGGRPMYVTQVVLGYVHEENHKGEQWEKGYRETRNLRTYEYQNILADSISKGIVSFITKYLERKDFQNIVVCIDPGHGEGTPIAEDEGKKGIIAYYKVYRSEQDVFEDGSRGQESSYEYVGDSGRYSPADGIAAPKKYVDMDVVRNKIYRYRVQPILADEFATLSGSETNVGLLSRGYGVAVSKDAFKVDELIDEIKGGSRDLANVEPRIIIDEFFQPISITNITGEIGYRIRFKVLNVEIPNYKSDIKVNCFFSDESIPDEEKISEGLFIKNIQVSNLKNGLYEAEVKGPGLLLKKLNFQIVVQAQTLFTEDDIVLTYPDRGKLR